MISSMGEVMFCYAEEASIRELCYPRVIVRITDVPIGTYYEPDILY
jgi:hypothetical protein